MSSTFDAVRTAGHDDPLSAGEVGGKLPGHGNDGGADAAESDADVAWVADPEAAVRTTLVEVAPGAAVLFGEIPAGVELLDLSLIPEIDREQMSRALGVLGNAGTIGGNVLGAMSGAQGLFRVNDATLSLLRSGGELAVKDGANLGAIFKNGQLVAQARFIPVSMTAATELAAIGPAIAMIGLQLQLSEIAGHVKSCVAHSKQHLKVVRNEQWSELEGLAEAVGAAYQEGRELGVITGTVWDPIASSDTPIRKQRNLYQKNVADHIRALGTLSGADKRRYLEANAESIVFDAHALLIALETYLRYQMLRAALARTRSVNDPNEAQLFDRITQEVPTTIDTWRGEISQLVEALVRALRLATDLPGRTAKGGRDAKASKRACTELLVAIEPLSAGLFPAIDIPDVPDTVCAPQELDLAPYLHVLRWHLERGETLRGVGFPYEVGAHNLAGVVPALLGKRVDATWNGLASGRGGGIVMKFASSTFVAVTDRRIVTADPKGFLDRGTLGPIHRLDEVAYVRPRSNHGAAVRPTIDVMTDQRDIHWMFPEAADHGHVDDFAALLMRVGGHPRETPAAIEPAEVATSL